MLTKFGKIANMFNGSDSFLPWTNNTSKLVCGCTTKNVLGENRYVCPYQYTGFSAEWRHINTAVTSGNVGANTAGFAVGSGTTPASVNDYTIENQILGLEQIGNASATDAYYDPDNDCTVAYKTVTLSNNTGSDVTISEVALFRTYYVNSTKGGSLSGQERFLVDRTILDEPVTIPNGEAGVIRIKALYSYTGE